MKPIPPLLPLAILTACTSAAGPKLPPAPTPSGQTPAPPGVAAPTAGASASPAPFAPTLTRLTPPGCCAQPYWSPDSRMVLFIDKPATAGSAGMYGVGVEGGAPQRVSDQIGLPSPDGSLLAFVNAQGQTVVRQVSGTIDHVIDNKGQRPYFSPGSKRIGWTISTPIDPVIGTRGDVSIADSDGSNARALLTVYDGGIAGWLDDDHLLVAGRKDASTRTVSLFSVDVNTGSQQNIASERRMRNIAIAPGGQWVVYAVTLDPATPPDDGLWVVSADGTRRTKLPLVGGAQWRDGSHLLVTPLEPGAPSHRLWQFDAATGVSGAITDPAATSFRIEAGEWSVSPDGKYVVFRSADDQALWLITLPPLGG